MTINKHNYEAFFLDYHEGNLAPQQVAELLLFVEKNPELKEEFESFENISLEDFSAISFENKEDLKKEITADNKDEYFIRSVENTTTPAEQLLVDKFLKQHPHFLADLELFKKTKLQADATIVFENKDRLKDIALASDHVLIASVEGLLSAQENAMLQQQLSVDAEMKHTFSLYQQTKVVADTTVIYENKEELKRKENRVVPFYYFIAAAAAILLLFGIFSLFNMNTTSEQPEIVKNDKGSKTQPVKGSDSVPQPADNNTTIPEPQNLSAAVAKTNTVNKKENPATTINIDSLKINAPLNKEPENKNLAQSNPAIKEQPLTNEQQQVVANDPNKDPHSNTPAVAQALIEKPEKKDNGEYLSLGQIAAKKIKQKTLDADTYASEKKAGKEKRFSGWDVLQVVAKGVSKVTGKDVQVKPTYNEDGDVTAYAFSAGKLGFSKEK